MNVEKQPEIVATNGEPTFRTRLEIALSPTFYGGLLYFGNRAKIINLKEARDGYIELMEGSLKNMKIKVD